MDNPKLGYISDYLAPSVFSAPLSSSIAVGTSSKLRAEMAHRACFDALAMTSSLNSVLPGACIGCALGGGMAALL